MHNSFKYINLSWAVEGICENARQPLWFHIPGIDEDEVAAVELLSLSLISQPLSTLVNLCQPFPRERKIKALKILRGRNALQR